MGEKYSQYHIIHLSETKHNNFTNYKIPKTFKTISRPGIRLGDKDRVGNIIFIRDTLYQKVRKTRYCEWGMILYFSDLSLIFVYFVPADSRYFIDETFTEFFNGLSGITKSSKNVIVVGDNNGRFGDLEFANQTYAKNVDNMRNPKDNLQ